MAVPDFASLRARLGVTLPPADIVAAPSEAVAALAGSDEARLLTAGQVLVPAAVLVPIILGPAAGVLLTRRTPHLSRHAGQVAFPGGRIDPGDASPEQAALREAQEEIGLDPRRVELAGRLPDYVTGTGYNVTPVLGLLAGDLDLTPSPHEVDAVLELPLAVLLDPAAPRRERTEINGVLREFWVWPHPEHNIWGATAAILVNLARLLRQEL